MSLKWQAAEGKVLTELKYCYLWGCLGTKHQSHSVGPCPKPGSCFKSGAKTAPKARNGSAHEVGTRVCPLHHLLHELGKVKEFKVGCNPFDGAQKLTEIPSWCHLEFRSTNAKGSQWS